MAAAFGHHRGARGDAMSNFPACWRRITLCCIASGGIALRLDGAAGADGGFEDVSKPDGQAQTPE